MTVFTHQAARYISAAHVSSYIQGPDMRTAWRWYDALYCIFLEAATTQLS